MQKVYLPLEDGMVRSPALENEISELLSLKKGDVACFLIYSAAGKWYLKLCTDQRWAVRIIVCWKFQFPLHEREGQHTN